MLSRYSLSDARIFRSSRERRAASRMSSRVTIQGMRRLRRSQARNASRLAATLAGSSATANAGCVTSMTGNLRPSAVAANTRARLSAAGRWDCMTGSRYAARRRHRGTTGNKSTLGPMVPRCRGDMSPCGVPSMSREPARSRCATRSRSAQISSRNKRRENGHCGSPRWAAGRIAADKTARRPALPTTST